MLRRIFLVVIGISAIGLYGSLYRVTDTECAVHVRDKQILADEKGSTLKKPGIYFKIPVLDSVIHWDTRIQHTTLKSMPLITLEDITLQLNYQLSWRVQDPVCYATRMVKDNFEPNDLFLRWVNEYLEANWQQKTFSALVESQFETLREEIAKHAKAMGIEIIAFRIIQKTPSHQSKQNILKQMKAHQAETIDAAVKQAKVEASLIEGQTKSHQAKLIAEAKEKAAAIQKEGEIAAMKLYTETYRKNPKFSDAFQRIVSETNGLNSKSAKLMIVQVTSPLSE